MKISLNWLKDYTEFKETDLQKISDAITAHTAEVDEVEVQGGILENCCVGRIKNLQKHPDADKLSTCLVETNKGDKPIVCGGTNLREGMCIAFAHVGAKVLTPKGELFELGAIKIRGEQSEGMICANVELGLEDMYPESPDDGERPVIDLGDVGENVGMPLREFLGMTDTILHIDNHAITHRPDLFSHIGFARECVAMGIAKWSFDGAEKNSSGPEFTKPACTKDTIPYTMNVANSNLMSRYLSCMIHIDELGQTPDWMKRRLEATGWRSINLPIDITNYVMMECGLPLHSFDADDIKGSITMRPAKKGEKIITLDQSERELSEGALILEDDEGIFDLLGIMGGLRSSTKSSTRNIYLHGASLDPVSIRKAMIEMGHRTDAGTVYEKAVQHYTTEQGFYRAVDLMLELIPGARIASEIESIGDNGAAPTIEVSVQRVQSHLGANIPVTIMKEILANLGCNVAGTDEVLQVSPPLWRLKDITGDHDIIEEIGRIYGYDNIDAVMPDANTMPPDREVRINAMRDHLAKVNYLELIPLSLTGPDLVTKCGFNPEDCIEIADPIGAELSLMQPCVLPRLLEHAEQYLRHSGGTLKTFHIGHVFSNKMPEYNQFGMLISPVHASGIKDESFYQAKQDVLEALGAAGFYVDATTASKDIPDYAHPGRCADITIEGQPVGYIFEVYPSIAKKFDLNRPSAVLLNVDKLLAVPAHTTVASALQQFPAIEYDETVPMSHSKDVQGLLGSLQGKSDMLESVSIADLYSGKPLEAGQYNLTLHFVYRSSEKTLTEQEVKAEHEKVMSGVSGI